MECNTIGGRIKQLRKEKELTQQQLADILHVKREAINQWENNARPINIDIAVELSKLFNVSCDYILRGVKAENVTVYNALGLSDKAITKLLKIKERDDNTLVGGNLRIGAGGDCETFKLKNGRTVTLEEIMENPNNYPGIECSSEWGISVFAKCYLPHNYLVAINRIIEDDDVEDFLESLISYLFGIDKDDKENVIIKDSIIGRRQLTHGEISEIILNGCMRFFRNLRDKISKQEEGK